MVVKKCKILFIVLTLTALSVSSLSCFISEEATLTEYIDNIQSSNFSSDPATITEKDGWGVFTNGNDVRTLIVKENIVWASTSGGIVKWDLNKRTYRKYTTLDGLGDNNVRGMIMDTDENLWVITGLGVSCLNGDSWITFTRSDGLAGDYVYSAILDNEGMMCFATDGGLCRFNGFDWFTFTEEDRFAQSRCTVIIQDERGNYWIGTAYNGVGCFNGANWQTFRQEDGLLFDPVDSIFEDNRGNIWVRSHNPATDSFPTGGWSVFNGTKWTTITVDNGIIANHAHFLGEDSQGNIWFGSDRGVSRFDGRKWKNFTTKNGLADDYVNSMVEDSEGNLWFACGCFDRGGVSRFDGENWETFNSNDGLPSDEIRFITKDSLGSIWTCTSKGISQYDGNQWRHYITGDGLYNNTVRAISQDAKGTMWFSSWTSICKFDGTSWAVYDSDHIVYDNQIYHDRDGNTWLFLHKKVFKYNGTEWEISDMSLPEEAYPYFNRDNFGYIWWKGKSNIYRFDGNELFNIPLPDSFRGRISVIMEDTYGDIWIGTSFGIWRFHDEIWSSYTDAEGLPESLIYDIDQDKNGAIWASTSGGVSYFDGNLWHRSKPYVKGDIFTEDAIVKDALGNLWFIALRDGVYRFNGTTWEHFKVEDGLIQNSISYAFADSKGNVWFVAENSAGVAGKVQPRYGVCKFDGENWQTYDTSNGLPRSIIDYMFEDQTGAIWFASLYGLARFTPE